MCVLQKTPQKGKDDGRLGQLGYLFQKPAVLCRSGLSKRGRGSSFELFEFLMPSKLKL